MVKCSVVSYRLGGSNVTTVESHKTGAFLSPCNFDGGEINFEKTKHQVLRINDWNR